MHVHTSANPGFVWPCIRCLVLPITVGIMIAATTRVNVTVAATQFAYVGTGGPALGFRATGGSRVFQ